MERQISASWAMPASPGQGDPRHPRSKERQALRHRVRHPERLKRARNDYPFEKPMTLSGDAGGSDGRGGVHPSAKRPAQGMDHQGGQGRQACPVRKASGAEPGRRGRNGRGRQGKRREADGSLHVPLHRAHQKDQGAAGAGRDRPGPPYQLHLPLPGWTICRTSGSAPGLAAAACGTWAATR